jgi:chromate transporter
VDAAGAHLLRRAARAHREAWQFGVLGAALVALLVLRRGVVITLLAAALVGVALALLGAPVP